MAKIALTGPMRSGKDTVADYLMDTYDFHRFAFSDGISKVCYILFPHILAAGRKPRKLYQGIGQDLRKYDPDVWVRYTFHEIGMTVPALESIVITDMRQPNEYRYLKAKGFAIVRVNAPYEARLERMRAAGDDFNLTDLNHETEQYLDSYAVDYELNNVGTHEELQFQVETMLNFFRTDPKFNADMERRGRPWVA